MKRFYGVVGAFALLIAVLSAWRAFRHRETAAEVIAKVNKCFQSQDWECVLNYDDPAEVRIYALAPARLQTLWNRYLHDTYATGFGEPVISPNAEGATAVSAWLTTAGAPATLDYDVVVGRRGTFCRGIISRAISGVMMSRYKREKAGSPAMIRGAINDGAFLIENTFNGLITYDQGEASLQPWKQVAAASVKRMQAAKAPMPADVKKLLASPRAKALK